MDHEVPGFSVLFFILPDGFGDRARKIAVGHGAGGGTLFYGSGTVTSKVLKFLSLEDSRKEILMMLVRSDALELILEISGRELKLDKPGTGVAFASPVSGYAGARGAQAPEQGGREIMASTHDLIITIVARGFSDDVMEASRKAGATGGTVITGRGTGVHETETFFGVKIEPEKEIILTLVPGCITSSVMEKISRELRIDEPGKGVLLCMPVSHVRGIVHEEATGPVKE
jgi:nitrogen regulatory protein PII